jgi:hypothetical protein
MWLAPAYVVIAFEVLAVAVAWLAYVAWPHHQIIEAIKSAPLAATISQTDAGLVKLAGNAFPPAPESSYVWRVTSRVDTSSSGSRSGTYSVAPIVVRDAGGDCRVDPQEARVLSARSEIDIQNQLFSGDVQRTERFILPGDPVFALGELDRSGGTCRHLMNYENRSLAEFGQALVRRTFWTFPGTDR